MIGACCSEIKMSPSKVPRAFIEMRLTRVQVEGLWWSSKSMASFAWSSAIRWIDPYRMVFIRSVIEINHFQPDQLYVAIMVDRIALWLSLGRSCHILFSFCFLHTSSTHGFITENPWRFFRGCMLHWHDSWLSAPFWFAPHVVLKFIWPLVICFIAITHFSSQQIVEFTVGLLIYATQPQT